MIRGMTSRLPKPGKGLGKLQRIEVAPATNGGFNVTHHFQSTPTYSRGANGGFGVSYSAPEEHAFGPNEHGALLNHIVQTLGLSQARADEAEVGGRLARTRSMRGARQAEREVAGEE